MNTGGTDQRQTEKLSWLIAAAEKGIEDLRAGRFEDGTIVMERVHQRLLDLKARKEAENEHRRHST